VKLLHGHSDAVEAFVAQLIPDAERGFSGAKGVGVIDKDGLMVAGWIWHNWNPAAKTISFSGASITPKWMTRGILQELFSYAFDGLGCQMVTTLNSGRNVRLHRQLSAFGFTRFDVPRMFGRDHDGVFWTLTFEQWKESRFFNGHRKTEGAKAA
jgi:RimJ/RimL family protein N-acetyltransferase